MKLFRLMVVLLVGTLICCGRPEPVVSDDDIPQPIVDPVTPEPEPEPEPEPAPDDGLPQTIHNGGHILVTNATIEKFLTVVHYDPNDYSYTAVMDYPVAPGESDIPPSFTIRWKEDASAESLVARLWEDEWCRDYSISASDGPHLVVTNLRPNAYYHYQVKSSASGKIMTEGEFYTYGHLHQVFFESTVRNARDLGG